MKRESEPQDAGLEGASEQRTSRMELLWPPSIRARVEKVAHDHDVTINEVVIQCIEAGIDNPVVLKILVEVAERRRPNRRYPRRKEGLHRAA